MKRKGCGAHLQSEPATYCAALRFARAHQESKGCGAHLESEPATDRAAFRLAGLRFARVPWKLISLASLMCALTSLAFGQQSPPTPEQPPAPQQQNPAATTAPPEISPEDPDYGEPQGVYFWLSRGTAKTLPGNPAQYFTQDQVLALPNARPRSPGVSVSIPAGKFNHLEISYFQMDGDGTGYAQIPLSLFGSNFVQGQFISTTYRIRSAQLTWNYLTWPAPPEDSKFRFRTLWSFNYTSVSPVIDEPYNTSVDFTAAHGTLNIFYPDFGVSLEYIPNKVFYFETRTWGFGFPHHADIADAEVNMVVRYKHMELFGGYKFFHFKTSPDQNQFIVGTLMGPIAGLRWVIR